MFKKSSHENSSKNNRDATISPPSIAKSPEIHPVQRKFLTELLLQDLFGSFSGLQAGKFITNNGDFQGLNWEHELSVKSWLEKKRRVDGGAFLECPLDGWQKSLHRQGRLIHSCLVCVRVTMRW